MTRSQIEYVLAVAKYENFGRAATACYISQSTLSAMIAKFEEQQGIEIFNRKTRPVSITPKGEEVLKNLRAINREYQLLDEKLNLLKGVEVGGTKPGLYSYGCTLPLSIYIKQIVNGSSTYLFHH